MRSSISQISRWLLPVLLVMYVGQSVASVSVPCHLLSQENEVQEAVSGSEHQHHMHGMEHSAHVGAGLPAIDTTSESDLEQGSLLQIAQTNAATTALHDCCDAMNHCTSGSCSISSLDGSQPHALLSAGSDALVSAADESPARFADSLYRPPILL